jgi:hypothetical protein
LLCFALGQQFYKQVTAVDEALRERRVAELRVLQFSSPRDLIDQYCRIAGESNGNQMPHGVSFSRMIDTIIDHEAEGEKSVVATVPQAVS